MFAPAHQPAALRPSTAPPADFFQPKLTVNTPGDAHEQEADRVANQVMRMPEGQSLNGGFFKPSPLSGVQRKCAACEKEEHAQRKETGSADASGKAAPQTVSDVLSSGSGQPMDAGTRQWAESRFGQDFGQVRIHTDSRAAESASAIQARAYTSGSNVVFGSGEYQPQSYSGKRLLAHELVHVGQQVRGVARNIIQRDANTCTYGEVREFAYLNEKGFPAPANLANVKASIGAACSRGNPCSCVSGANATGAQDRAAWQNITGATGGVDQSANANFMCVNTQQCGFVHQCRPYRQPNQPLPPLQERAQNLTPVATLTLNGASIYFYRDARNGNCPPRQTQRPQTGGVPTR